MATQTKDKNKRLQTGVMFSAACLLLLGVWLLLASPGTAWAEKGGKGKTGQVGGDVSGWIFCRVTFNDSGAVQSDGLGEYLDGVDRTGMRIGRNRNISMDFNTHNKKPSIRTLHFPDGFPLPTPLPAGDACMPILFEGEQPATPVGPAPAIALAAKDAQLVIRGEDHDDTPVGCCRAVNAALRVTDDNDQTWIIHFGTKGSGDGTVFFAPCSDDVIVERLPNVDSDGDGLPDNPGFSRWIFSTTGYGYVYRDNNPPHAATEFWGTVSLPFSGVIESLTDELEPTGDCSDFPDSIDCP